MGRLVVSRTDAHRPYRVWLADHPELVTAHHCHGQAACDLPLDRSVSATGCRWSLIPSAPSLCCCDVRHAGSWRRLDVRRCRQRDRLLLRFRPTDLDDWADLEVSMGRH